MLSAVPRPPSVAPFAYDGGRGGQIFRGKSLGTGPQADFPVYDLQGGRAHIGLSYEIVPETGACMVPYGRSPALARTPAASRLCPAALSGGGDGPKDGR